MNRPCRTCLVLLVTSSVSKVVDIYLVQRRETFLTIPEWAWCSQTGLRKTSGSKNYPPPTPHPPTEGIFPWIPHPLPLSSFIHLLNFWAFEKPPPPWNFQSPLQGSMDISLNYTMQKKTWPKNNCNENLTPLPNCYFFHLIFKILKVLHLTLKIKWDKKNERRGKEREWNLVQRGGGSITFKPPNYVMYLEILPPAHSPTS